MVNRRCFRVTTESPPSCVGNLARQGPFGGSFLRLRRVSRHRFGKKIHLLQSTLQARKYGMSSSRSRSYFPRMATEPDYYIETVETDARPHPWRWELRRRSTPMGMKVGAGGFQSKTAAEQAGKQALQRFLEDLAREARRK